MTSFLDFLPINKIIPKDREAQVVRPTDANDEIVLGLREGATGWTKFGYNADVDSAAIEVVATFGGTFTPLTTASTFTIAYDGTGGGSTDGAGTTGAQQLTFYYLDENGEDAIAVHTLGTDGSDVTSFSGLGINRVAVSSSGSAEVNNSIITITATTGGTNQAQIPAGDGVTQQAIFFLANNRTGIVKGGRLNVRKLTGGSAPRVTLRGWVYNRSIATKFEVLRVDIDTAVENNVPFAEAEGFRINPSDVLYFEAETNTDNTIVGVRFSVTTYETS